MIEIEYEEFVKYVFEGGKNTVSKKRLLEGKFTSGNFRKPTKEEVNAYDLNGSAMKSYQCLVAWFNRTLRPFEKKRKVVSAKWKE